MKKPKIESKSKSKTDTSNKKQLNIRASKRLRDLIEGGAKMAGLTQADFVERCVSLNAEAAADMADQERIELRAKFKKLQEDAKLNK
jgi:uncharacterized protein (DUF1778 family)